MEAKEKRKEVDKRREKLERWFKGYELKQKNTTTTTEDDVGVKEGARG